MYEIAPPPKTAGTVIKGITSPFVIGWDPKIHLIKVVNLTQQQPTLPMQSKVIRLSSYKQPEWWFLKIVVESSCQSMYFLTMETNYLTYVTERLQQSVWAAKQPNSMLFLWWFCLCCWRKTYNLFKQSQRLHITPYHATVINNLRGLIFLDKVWT